MLCNMQHTQVITQEYLSPRELAVRLSVSLRMAYKLGEIGTLPVLRIGGTVRYPVAAIEAYEKANTAQAVPA
jgi:excisionase family DNA binding protein